MVLPIVEGQEGSEFVSGTWVMRLPDPKPALATRRARSASTGRRWPADVFAGDALHKSAGAAVEMEQPLREGPRSGAQSRHTLLVRLRGTRALLMPAHFAPPHAAYVRDKGDRPDRLGLGQRPWPIKGWIASPDDWPQRDRRSRVAAEPSSRPAGVSSGMERRDRRARPRRASAPLPGVGIGMAAPKIGLDACPGRAVDLQEVASLACKRRPIGRAARVRNCAYAGYTSEVAVGDEGRGDVLLKAGWLTVGEIARRHEPRQRSGVHEVADPQAWEQAF